MVESMYKSLTHSLKLLFELREVVAPGDAEVVVRVVGLVHDVGRVGGADGKHRRWPLSPLRSPDLLHLGHDSCFSLVLSSQTTTTSRALQLEQLMACFGCGGDGWNGA